MSVAGKSFVSIKSKRAWLTYQKFSFCEIIIKFISWVSYCEYVGKGLIGILFCLRENFEGWLILKWTP